MNASHLFALLSIGAAANLISVGAALAAGSINGRWCAGDLVYSISSSQITVSNKQTDVATIYRVTRLETAGNTIRARVNTGNGRTGSYIFGDFNGGKMVRVLSSGGRQPLARC